MEQHLYCASGNLDVNEVNRVIFFYVELMLMLTCFGIWHILSK